MIQKKRYDTRNKQDRRNPGNHQKLCRDTKMIEGLGKHIPWRIYRRDGKPRPLRSMYSRSYTHRRRKRFPRLQETSRSLLQQSYCDRRRGK